MRGLLTTFFLVGLASAGSAVVHAESMTAAAKLATSDAN